MRQVTAYVGIGANLGDARAQVLAAFEELGRLPQTRLTGRSSLYRSAPQGYAPQPDFVNAVARLETGLGAHDLMQKLLDIERRHGRVRPFANAPRTLDLDLLLYGEEKIEDKLLVVPHPRMLERRFVLEPLAELGVGVEKEALEKTRSQPVEKMP